ncbi:GAF domain-containing protein [Streptomyces pseudovenezuelae]|uniref:GAF domain-containing protein n=1 Tax=Streptomyces pseudovenezuelae TaxID=67350 RepID=UPI00380D7069
MTRERRLAEIFVEVADSLVEDFDVIDLLQRLSARCVELLDVSAAGILLADAHGELQVIAASDERTRLLELFALQHDQGPCVECYRTGTARTDIDLTRPEPAMGWSRFAARARETGYVSTHAIPLRLRRRVVGALNLFQTTAHRLGDDDIALAQALADVATIAILQQRTLERSHLENSQLESALTSRILIEQVKGVLAERWNTSVDDAFEAFRSYARAVTFACPSWRNRSSPAASTARPSRHRHRHHRIHATTASADRRPVSGKATSRRTRSPCSPPELPRTDRPTCVSAPPPPRSREGPASSSPWTSPAPPNRRGPGWRAVAPRGRTAVGPEGISRSRTFRLFGE